MIDDRLIRPADGPDRSGIENEFAYRYLLAAIPAAGLCCTIAAFVLCLLYRPPQFRLGVAMIAISWACFWLRWRVLPFIRHRYQLDLVAGSVFGAAAAANMMGAFDLGTDSPISCGLLILACAFAFPSGKAYAAFVVFALVGQTLARYVSPFPLGIGYAHLLVLAPIYCAIAFMALRALRRHVEAARRQLQDNVDALRRERERRIESEKRLVHAQKMEGLGLVAAGVAHDFNNHLQAISAFAELIVTGDDTASHAEQIKASAANASEICSQMLAYAGKSQQQQVLIDLSRLIRDTQPILFADLPESVTLDFALPQQGPMIRGGKTGVRECFLNIVRNAIEACGDAGRVVIVADTKHVTSEVGRWRVFGNELPTGAYVVIEITDNGSGMDPDILERAFDPYFTTKSTGHGFGLATSLGMMRMYRGAIRVRSNDEVGTVFQMIFPPIDVAETIPVAPESTHSASSLVKNILLVDDDPSVANAVTLLLRKKGCEVTCVHSGREALDILGRLRPSFDLMLIDYSMPQMSGIELLERIREMGITVPAVICTGYAKDTILDRQGVRPDGILNKPYSVPDILHVLETIHSPEQRDVSATD